MKGRKKLWLIPVGILGLLMLCIVVALLLPSSEDSEGGTPAPTRTATETRTPKPTKAPTDTRTPKPTKAPTDTRTPKPTATPKDTATPTNTPLPTETPTPLPTPMTWSGAGDAIVDLDRAAAPGVLHITGNAAARYFGVTSLDADGNTIDLLVNTSDPYEGYRPIDFREGPAAKRLQIKAEGAWSITCVPLAAEYMEGFVLEVPGTHEGKGDEVLLLAGAEADLATISGNADARYFGVIAYSSSISLLINTTDPYEGTVAMPRRALALEIRAEGPWTISLTAR